MPLFLHFAGNFLIFILLISLIAVSGLILLHFLNYKTAVRQSKYLFFSLLLGVCFWVSAFSIFRTGFQTVNLAFILIALFLLITQHKTARPSFHAILASLKEFFRAHILKIVLGSLPFYMFEALFFFQSGMFHMSIPFVDYIDMYNISQVITQTGQENNKYLLSNYYFEAFHGLSPYHFFELWLNGLFSYLLPLPGTLTLMLFVYPFFYYVSFIGVLALWELHGQLRWYKVGLSYIILLAGGMYFEFYTNFELLRWYGGTVGNLMHAWAKKSAVLYPFAIAAYLSFYRGKHVHFTAFMLFMGIAAIGVLPGITGGLILFALLNFRHKTYSAKELKLIWLLTGLFIVVTIGIFLLMGNKNEETLGFSAIMGDLLASLNINFFKIIFFRVIFPALRLLVIFSPFLIFIAYALWQQSRTDNAAFIKNIKLLLILVLVLFTGSIIGGFASINIFSGGQFFSYLFYLLVVFIIFIFVQFYSSFEVFPFKAKKIPAYFFLIAIGCACLYNFYSNAVMHRHYKHTSQQMYDRKYIKEVTTYLNTNDLNPLGVCFMGQDDITTYPLNAYGITGLTFSGFSVKLTNKFHAVSNLSIYDLELDTNDRFSGALFKTFEFYNFVKKQQAEGVFDCFEQSKADFINTFQIDYALIYRHGILPETLDKSIKHEIHDPLSGQKFLVFD